MKKEVLLFLLFSLLSMHLFAKHIIGGEMYYKYIGKGTTPNTSRYEITLMLFRDDNAPADAAQMPTEVFIGIFNNDDNRQYPSAGSYFEVKLTDSKSVTINPFPTCMVNRPSLGYHGATYTFPIDLPDNTSGYTATYQTCCRITPIENIMSGNSGAGSTFSSVIPPVPDNSPIFMASIDAVCGGKQFNLRFKATDADGDSLSYAFEGAYEGGAAHGAQNINPAPPPYGSVTYLGTFSASHPLGPDAIINPEDGTITGIAPPPGRYVVTVAATSWRGGQKLSTHRKDFIINVSDCDFATARLDPRGAYCDDYTVSFSNDDFSAQNKTFYWEFYDSDADLITTSTEETPKITFGKEGVYNYKLIVNPGGQCSDSAEASIGVFPGFFPDFDFDGRCINSEVFFTDRSTANFGVVNSWKWDFGVSGIASDTSLDKNPHYTYNKEGTYNVSLTAISSVGCVATIKDTIKMLEKPPFSVSNDTLICSVDNLQLFASGKGTVEWTPNYNINDIHSLNPTVSPKRTTTYYANYQEGRGCDNMDSVVVNVVDQVTLSLPADTTICLTDSITLKPQSDGLRYQWSPSATVLNDTAKNTSVFPAGNTTYQLMASIGNCNTTRRINVKTVPYPSASAGPDTIICLGNPVQITAKGGSIYEWQPAVFLNDNKIANPVSSPARTIQYTVKVNDILGCPKPGYDTILVNVITPFVDAGPRDTAIVVDEPLQLNAVANGENFLWTPPTGLSNPYISNPVALLKSDQEYIVRIITEGNCVARDTMMVKVYNLKPGFYIPNAFTPNNDGLNDIIRPVAFGLRSLKYFRIYNRLGQIVYSTNNFNEGWDGTFKGSPQGSGVFAWTAEAVDYTGKRVLAKGSITLIR